MITVTDITYANINLDCGHGEFAENGTSFKMTNHKMNVELTFFLFVRNTFDIWISIPGVLENRKISDAERG